MDRTEKPLREWNILELLCELDDFLLLKMLSLMDPIKLILLGGTCQRFYRLTSGPKLWQEIIEREGLMETLKRKRGGPKNLKRIGVMKKTLKTHLTSTYSHDTISLIRTIKRQAYNDLKRAFNVLYKDQTACDHPTIEYDLDLQKVKCPKCFTFATDFDKRLPTTRYYIQEYLKMFKPTNQVVTLEYTA